MIKREVGPWCETIGHPCLKLITHTHTLFATTQHDEQLVGQYGFRNAMRARTYIENDATNVAWTALQVGVDAGLVMAILRKHPYSLLPVLLLNALGHSSYPGTGLRALDGLDIFGLG